MIQPTIWHNPRCSKSRAALHWLQSQGLNPKVVDFLKSPPSASDLSAALAMLGGNPLVMMRTGDDGFQAAGVTKHSPADALLAAMIAAPELIERPIVFYKGRAAIARPIDNIQALFAADSNDR